MEFTAAVLLKMSGAAVCVSRTVERVSGEQVVGTETSPQRLLAEHRLAPQNVVIVLGEAVGFVADVLQQPQARRSGG